MFSYYSGRLDSVLVIIYTSSITTPVIFKSPLNNPSSVIQSSGFLVTSSYFFPSLVLDDFVIDWNFLLKFPRASKAHPLVISLVTNSKNLETRHVILSQNQFIVRVIV